MSVPLSTSKHDAIGSSALTLHAEIDALVKRYNSRMLAAALLHRSMLLYNGLIQHSIVDVMQFSAISENAIDIAFDETIAKPTLVLRAEDEARPS